MVTSDMLLQLIADLQHDVTVAHGRRRLLEYVQASSRARQAVLFVLDQERQTLVLLEQCGRRPSSLHQKSSVNADSYKGQRTRRGHIAIHGLFGSMLGKPGLRIIFAEDIDFRSLPEEQYWIGQNGAVALGGVGKEGVLVLCFEPGDNVEQKIANAGEDNLLVCMTLLAGYLTLKENRVPFVGATLAAALPHAGEASSPDARFLRGARAAPTRMPGTVEQLADFYEVTIQKAIDEERSRIARDIHDGAAQHIAHVIHKLEFIQRVFEKQPEVALYEIDRTTAILKESLNDLRHGIASLIPIQLEEQGFASALKSLLEEYRSSEPTLSIDYEDEDVTLLPLSLEVPVFRFLQEALNNVRKHAQARRASIRMQVLPGLLLVEVSDNGVGFDVEEAMSNLHIGAAQRLGIRSMKYRIEQAGGRWEIWSKGGAGTTVKACFPLAAPSAILTNREREVLRLLIEGLTNREIAERLSVSIETVKSHVRHIIQKMQVTDRTRAAVKATKQQWL